MHASLAHSLCGEEISTSTSTHCVCAQRFECGLLPPAHSPVAHTCGKCARTRAHTAVYFLYFVCFLAVHHTHPRGTACEVIRVFACVRAAFVEQIPIDPGPRPHPLRTEMQRGNILCTLTLRSGSHAMHARACVRASDGFGEKSIHRKNNAASQQRSHILAASDVIYCRGTPAAVSTCCCRCCCCCS